MIPITRRRFSATALALGTRATSPAAPTIDETLRAGVNSRRIAAAVAVVAGPEKTLYTGAFGQRDTSGPAVTADSIFGIASMTKAITTTAALQLVERGKLKLDEPVAKHLPQLDKLQILDGFDKDTGKPILHPAARPVLLSHLLTHTAGFVYSIWDEKLKRYEAAVARQQLGRPVNKGVLTKCRFRQD